MGGRGAQFAVDSGAPSPRPRHGKQKKSTNKTSVEEIAAKITAEFYTFHELAASTKNFRQESLLGEGGFGRVYKGVLDKTGETVALKQLDRHALQGNKEFLAEVLMLSDLRHQNLVNLIGYCADGDQRMLVYECMPLGSLDNHLFDLPPTQKPLNWSTRMKIALDAAQGLEYLHEKASPPVIYGDLKSSSILLDDEYNAKLSDVGLVNVGPNEDKSQVSSRVTGTSGYCAPEYHSTGQLTRKSDVYSFGVILLELITGRRAIDPTKPTQEEDLVSWAEPVFKSPNRHHELADPILQGDFPVKSLSQAVVIAAMCVQDNDCLRPVMTDVVSALSYLGKGLDDSITLLGSFAHRQSDEI